MMKKLFITLILMLLVTVSHAKTYKIALFSPKGNSPFWTLVANLAEEAANDLGIKLRVYDAKLNQLKMINQVKKAVTGPDKVDAVVFSNFKQSAFPIIKIAEEAGVFAFLFNSGMGKNTLLKAGQPREKFKHWIGEMLPDDEGTAMKITDQLINDAIEKGKVASDGKVYVVGVGGIVSDATSIVRINGLKKAINRRTDAVLKQVAPTDFGAEKGKRALLGLIQRYPQTTVVWSASYRITDGILEGIKEKNLVPGKDILTNTLVLNEKALRTVKSGEVVVTAGGHYIEGAWVMVLLYDYFHGIDFAGESLKMRTPMGIVTKDNVDLYLKNLTKEKLSKENLKKINFAQYSKKKNPGLKKYNFNLDSVLDQL
ncbi:MAG TPA: hypothetical protein ENI02_00965 [Candidatus Aminicenantes bacterium]|nr:hypothetical protein [Candidatus Aminicenantes bacterium]